MRLIKKLAAFPRPYYVAGTLLWAGCILLLLLVPGSSVPRVGIPHADKVVHAGMFFVLAYFIWHAIGTPALLGRFSIRPLSTFLLATAYGIATELLQQSAATRTADVYDAVADAFGACTFVLLMLWDQKRTTTTRGES